MKKKKSWKTQTNPSAYLVCLSSPYVPLTTSRNKKAHNNNNATHDVDLLLQVLLYSKNKGKSVPV